MCILGCKNYCIYNNVGKEPFYCGIHKENNMFDVRKKCIKCDKRATFNGYCQAHKSNKRKITECDILVKRCSVHKNEVHIDDFVFDSRIFSNSHLDAESNVYLVTDQDLIART